MRFWIPSVEPLTERFVPVLRRANEQPSKGLPRFDKVDRCYWSDKQGVIVLRAWRLIGGRVLLVTDSIKLFLRSVILAAVIVS